MIISKDTFGYLSLAVVCVSYTTYFLSIVCHQTKPHAFSWVIWGLLTAIGFYAQYTNEAGAGAWATGCTAAACFLVAVVSMFYGEKNITKSDWFTFIAAILIIPFWYCTQNPLMAVMLVSIIDGLGYYPTFRKSYLKPFEESLPVYVISILQVFLSMLAMEHYFLVNIVYPTFTVIANILFVSVVMWRRHIFRH